MTASAPSGRAYPAPSRFSQPLRRAAGAICSRAEPPCRKPWPDAKPRCSRGCRAQEPHSPAPRGRPWRARRESPRVCGYERAHRGYRCAGSTAGAQNRAAAHSAQTDKGNRGTHGLSSNKDLHCCALSQPQCLFGAWRRLAGSHAAPARAIRADLSEDNQVVLS